jgi:hypothetical protein
MGELQVADVRNQVMLSLFTDFDNFTVFTPHPRHETSLNAMLDQLVAWGGALKGLRALSACSASAVLRKRSRRTRSPAQCGLRRSPSRSCA